MDIFGIGQAVKGALKIYFRSARATGRTQHMVNIVRDGDHIIFDNNTEAQRVQRLLKERGKDVKCLVAQVDGAYHSMEQFRPIKGRVYFDHTWVEKFYMKNIEQLEDWVDDMQNRLSNAPEPQKIDPNSPNFAKWTI